jgi:hypothetical protein
VNTKSKYNSNEYINKEFGKLRVLEYLSSNSIENELGEPAFKCQCSCGNIAIKRVKHVVKKVSTCCDECNRANKIKSKYNTEDFIGRTFGQLYIKQFLDGSNPINTENCPAYVCECSCGNIVIKKASHVVAGNIKSCGECHESRSKYANEEYIGKQFGKLIVVGIGHNDFENTFICNCSCNRSDNIEYSASMVANGYKKQCKLCSEEAQLELLDKIRKDRMQIQYTEEFLKSLIGNKYGKLTVKSIFKNNDNRTCASCDCDCGTINHTVMLSNLINTNHPTRACGKCRIAPNHKYDNTEYIGKTFNGLTVIDIKKENSKTYWKCRCNLCDSHNEVWFSAHNVISGNNKSCGCMQSYREYIIEKALKSRNINYKKQITFDGLKGIRGGTLRFDFGIYDNIGKLLGIIEYDGEQHFKDINETYYVTEFEAENNINITKENDKIKNKFCTDNNIQLVRLNGTINEDIFFRKMQAACAK